MPVDPETLKQVRQAARARRRAASSASAPASEARKALAGIIDVGALSDDDVMMLYGVYLAALQTDDALRAD
jgi:hypothetical protein